MIKQQNKRYRSLLKYGCSISRKKHVNFSLFYVLSLKGVLHTKHHGSWHLKQSDLTAILEFVIPM